MNKKVLLSSGLIILLGGFFVYEKFIATQTSGNNLPPPNSTQITQATTGFKDGIYTGNTINSMYGPAQVQIVISSGQITNVNFLQYPSDRSTSLRKSQMAMPVIKQEVIQSQSANVNTVSGATETSSSFIQSISSAISQAS